VEEKDEEEKEKEKEGRGKYVSIEDVFRGEAMEFQ